MRGGGGGGGGGGGPKGDEQPGPRWLALVLAGVVVGRGETVTWNAIASKVRLIADGTRRTNRNKGCRRCNTVPRH